MDISGKIGWICMVALIFLAFSDQRAEERKAIKDNKFDTIEDTRLQDQD
tara:strand:+ start:4684 stop:4830 length:147 start_codon:yes stop_codon:yes gene_type:complete